MIVLQTAAKVLCVAVNGKVAEGPGSANAQRYAIAPGRRIIIRPMEMVVECVMVGRGRYARDPRLSTRQV